MDATKGLVEGINCALSPENVFKCYAEKCNFVHKFYLVIKRIQEIRWRHRPYFWIRHWLSTLREAHCIAQYLRLVHVFV